MTACAYCDDPDRRSVTYNFTCFCCAVRYVRNTPAIRREGAYLALQKHHDVAVLRAAVEATK